MKKNKNMISRKIKIIIFVNIVIAFFTFTGWHLSAANAQDAFEPDNSPTEANLMIVNEFPLPEHTLHNESDEDWFVYYWTVDPNYDPNPEDEFPAEPLNERHTVLIYDSADESNEREDIIWEVFDRDGIKLDSGFSGENFSPADIPPPLGPLGSEFYFFKLRRDPNIDFDKEITYFLKLQGTAIPKVRGFITDADSKQGLANVTVTTNLPNPIPIQSISNGLYMLHVRESIIILTYELDGYVTRTATVDTVVDDQYRIDIEMSPFIPVEDAFEPDNSSTEANLMIVNEFPLPEHTLHNESDEDWFVYYWTVDPNYDPNPEDDIPAEPLNERHTVLIYDSADESNEREDIIWEVFDRDGIKLDSGFSGENFSPADIPPPLGPLGSEFYFFKLRRDPNIDFDKEITYFLKLQGTAIPKVRGFITDADSKQGLANVTVTTNLPNPIPIQSISNGLYMLHVRESIIILTYELDGYVTRTATVDTVVDDQYRIDIEMSPVDPVVDPVEDFVTRFYRLILDREPDSLAQGWVDDLLSGRSAGCDIARGFVFSPEFINRNTSDEAYVDILYQAFFDRAADTAGKNGWLNVLQSGSPREDVLDGFLFSQEFSNLAAGFRITACETPGVGGKSLEDFVTRFYRLILDREPDSLAQVWVDDLLSGKNTGCDIARGFVFSPEFINRNTSDEAYVDILYQAFFNRAADTAGKNGWLNVLQSGSPREDVLDGFLFSQEFANLAASFGIIACAAPAS